jgi:hypothetical protein
MKYFTLLAMIIFIFDSLFEEEKIIPPDVLPKNNGVAKVKR